MRIALSDDSKSVKLLRLAVVVPFLGLSGRALAHESTPPPNATREVLLAEVAAGFVPEGIHWASDRGVVLLNAACDRDQSFAASGGKDPREGSDYLRTACEWGLLEACQAYAGALRRDDHLDESEGWRRDLCLNHGFKATCQPIGSLQNHEPAP